MKEKELKYKRLRIGVVGVFLLFSFIVIIGRLYYIQVIQHSRYADYSRNQYVQKITFNPTRGKILDRNRTPLAVTVPMKSVYASPYRVKDPKTTAITLARTLTIDATDVMRKLEKEKNFVWIDRKITPAKFEALKVRDIPGVSFLSEDKRFYPQKSFGARVIGFCGIDNQGLAGLEYFYDKTLTGEPAIFLAQKDAMGRIAGFAGAGNEVDRVEMLLTLDSNIQYIAEKVVRDSFEKYEAKSAIAIVMATKTGEILAMAEQPDLNPNNFVSYPASYFKSLSVTQNYEPGSTFKVFLAAAALDSKAATPNDKFHCENGFYRIGDKTIREANNRRFGVLSFKDIIKNSSNIGSIKVAQRLGQKKFYRYIRKFGFGERTGVDLPGEASGFVRDLKEWSGLSLPSASFGQEILVTPIQLVTALSVLGNGGMAVKPYFLKQVLKNGVVVRENVSPPARRLISEKAARQTVEMMRTVVTDGTGKQAYVPGYDIAGKTGTAQKFDREHAQYSKEKHMSSFLALYPAYDPILSVLVMVDEPSGKGWGGIVAAPMGRDIIVATARYYGIPSARDSHYEVDWDSLRRSFAPVRTKSVEAKKVEGPAWMSKMFAFIAPPDEEKRL